jgi:hypothetical protein
VGTVNLTFAGDKVGLIVRGKSSHTHHPGVMEQHADVILSNGAPVGFFGEGAGGASSGNSSHQPGGSSGSSGGTSGSTGMGMDGVVYDFAEMQKKRAHYVDGSIAKAYKVVSAVLIIPVTAKQASDFDAYWTGLKAKPDTFYILGGNCSTRASRGFENSGILSGGMDMLGSGRRALVTW